MSFEIKPATSPRRRIVKKPSIAGNKNPRWKGGEITTKDGRVMLHCAGHPFPSKGNYVYRYRLKMEKKLGRYLTPGEVIHHKNGNPSDDRISNLEVLFTQKHNTISARDHWRKK
jgi:hypothetical protein